MLKLGLGLGYQVIDSILQWCFSFRSMNLNVSRSWPFAWAFSTFCDLFEDQKSSGQERWFFKDVRRSEKISKSHSKWLLYVNTSILVFKLNRFVLTTCTFGILASWVIAIYRQKIDTRWFGHAFNLFVINSRKLSR